MPVGLVLDRAIINLKYPATRLPVVVNNALGNQIVDQSSTIGIIAVNAQLHALPELNVLLTQILASAQTRQQKPPLRVPFHEVDPHS